MGNTPLIRFLSVAAALLTFSLPLTGQNHIRWNRPDSPQTVNFRYPMRITPEISGSFAELRNTHFHGGMDFRTQQREGIKVYSAAPGRIIRASVSRLSYGLALYVRHPDSSISVYAHLSKFSQPVRRKIKRLQRQKDSYEVDLSGLSVRTRKNRPIGLSGNTGASGGPHLHFEILKNGIRFNPAALGLSVPDSVAPNLLFFSVYTPQLPEPVAQAASFSPDSVFADLFMDAAHADYRMYQALCLEADSLSLEVPPRRQTIGNTEEVFRLHDFAIDTMRWTGWYYEAGRLPDTLFLSGPAAFGLCALDSIQRMPFNYGLYRLLFASRELSDTVRSDNGVWDTLAYYQLDAMPIPVFAAIKSHIDLPFFAAKGKRLEKSWIGPEQKLTPYRKISRNGIFYPQSGKRYLLLILAQDLAGNTSRIRIPIVAL